MTDPQPQPEPQEGTEDSAAAMAREQAIRVAVSMGVELAVLLAITFVVHHQDALALRAKRVARRIRNARTPGDAGLQAAEFAATVSAWDHAEGTRK
jgi:hypothetical protein